MIILGAFPTRTLAGVKYYKIEAIFSNKLLAIPTSLLTNDVTAIKLNQIFPTSYLS